MKTINEPSQSTLVEIYRKAMLIRLCSERVILAIRTGKIKTPYYSPRGQEIVASAMAVNLNTEDYLITIYRGIHDHLAKGVPLKEMWAEFAGRATGSCKGKGGPMHITHPASGVMVTTGIVGGGIPIANGLGLASQIRGDGRVTVTNFGDGTSNIGAFHESLNLASLWKLPVIFLCQNNQYAEHTSFAAGTAVENIADRASSYNMVGVSVDGNDPVAMWRASAEAVARARAGDGPTLIEAKTFRFEGHVFGDPGHYIPKSELEAAIAADPVPALRARLIDMGAADETSLLALEDRIKREINEAVELALAAPYPAPEELHRHVFAEELV